VETIFIGGGTPSLLSTAEFDTLSRSIHRFCLSDLREWTIEVNPESYTDPKARAWRYAGADRISLGVQSLSAKELDRVGRLHSPQDIKTVLDSPQLAQFDRISADIIYGLPGQSRKNLRGAIDFLGNHGVIQHISAYELTFHENTLLDAQKKAGQHLSSRDSTESLARACRSHLEKHGFIPYEVSNFARPNNQCRHNKIYWERKPYLGLGPGAHSFDGVHRFETCPSLTDYLHTDFHSRYTSLSPGPIEKQEALEEYLFLGLRTRRGIIKKELENLSTASFCSGERKSVLAAYLEEGFLYETPEAFIPTYEGMLRADGMAATLV
jgi:oxygen-independent coproporphyrinogen-3 oxidase